MGDTSLELGKEGSQLSMQGEHKATKTQQPLCESSAGAVKAIGQRLWWTEEHVDDLKWTVLEVEKFLEAS